jgi:hypothetical protein
MERKPRMTIGRLQMAESMSYMVSFLRGASSDWYMEIV